MRKLIRVDVDLKTSFQVTIPNLPERDHDDSSCALRTDEEPHECTCGAEAYNERREERLAERAEAEVKKFIIVTKGFKRVRHRKFQLQADV